MDTEQILRPRFYEQQYLGAADLAAAVDYGRLHDARHLLGGHTWGISIGLQLKERPVPGGALDVYVQPGFAWDGFGRPIVVVEPYRIPVERFTSLLYDPTRDEPNGREMPVWIRYEEAAVGGPAVGFEVCVTDEQYSRVQEGSRVEAGPMIEGELSDQIVVAGRTIHPEDAFKTFDPSDPAIPDESIPHQTFPANYARARWLIPLGFIRWKPSATVPRTGEFRQRSPADVLRSNHDRVYVGVIAESVEAAGSVIRLKDRFVVPSSLVSDELVWVEGHLRFDKDARLFGGRLEFRKSDGKVDDGVNAAMSVPLTMQRVSSKVGGTTYTDLQIKIGEDDDPAHRLVIGRATPTGIVEKVTIRADGRMGIGTTAPRSPLGIRGTGADEELISFEDKTGNTKWHISQNLGGNTPGLNFVETDALGGNGRLFLAPGGKAGMGTTTPTGALTINGIVQPAQGKLTFFDTTADMVYDGGDDFLFIFRHTGGPTARTAFLGSAIGIGEANPLGPLHVSQPGNVNIILDHSGGAEHLAMMVTNQLSGLRFSDSNVFFIASQPYPSRADHASIREHLRITSHGFVGIGTQNPDAELHVHGRIRLGTGEPLFAPGCPGNVRMIVGRVAPNGVKLSGDGFLSAQNSIGTYSIAFIPAFSSPPAVVATVRDDEGFDNTINVTNLSGASVTFVIVDSSDNLVEDDEFSFIAVGPK
jgi:hypothetical protein